MFQLTRKNRIPILAFRPLLARAGEAEVPVLGGDQIGARPVDIHLEALAKLGAKLQITKNSYHAWAKDGLHGANIELRFPSVGATENVILAAVLAHGKTILKNAALEPEIMDLVKMLQNMGAIIELSPPRTITIEGVKKIARSDASHFAGPQRSGIVRLPCDRDARKSSREGRDPRPPHNVFQRRRRMGAEYEVGDEGITFWVPNGKLNPVFVTTDVHPGFMTDWQQPLAVCMTQAEGASSIHETIYEDRFGYAHDLNEMGAKIHVVPDCPEEEKCRYAGRGLYHYAVVEGPTSFTRRI